MNYAMDIDTTLMEEYPYRGAFYSAAIVDPEVSLLDQDERETLIFETKCDIQQSSILGNAGFKTTTYDVYFPMKLEDFSLAIGNAGFLMVEDGKYLKVVHKGIKVRRGMRFRGRAHGYPIDGLVQGVGFSLLGGIVVQIKDYTE